MELNFKAIGKRIKIARLKTDLTQEIMAEKEKTESILEDKMERWMYLSHLAEQIAAQK